MATARSSGKVALPMIGIIRRAPTGRDRCLSAIAHRPWFIPESIRRRRIPAILGGRRSDVAKSSRMMERGFTWLLRTGCAPALDFSPPLMSRTQPKQYRQPIITQFFANLAFKVSTIIVGERLRIIYEEEKGRRTDRICLFKINLCCIHDFQPTITP